MKEFVVSSLLLLACLSDFTLASSQQQQQPDKDLYYGDVATVLQDFSNGEYSALFIKYHGCVWSEFGYNDGDGDGDGDDNGDGDSGCPESGGEENELWYLGFTQCFRPNVAFSLYGTKEESRFSKFDSCSNKHYINSFFTKGGIESFGYATGFDYDNYGAYTTCSDGDGNNNRDLSEDEYNDQSNGNMLYGDYTSYGLACSASGDFVTAQFTGAYCTGDHFVQATEDYNKMNKQLKNDYGCTLVYDSGKEYNGDDDGNDQQQQQDYGNVNQSPAWYLLESSTACSTYEYPNRCPDPHGVKKRMDRKRQHTASHSDKPYPKSIPYVSLVLILFSLLFLTMSMRLRKKIAMLS